MKRQTNIIISVSNIDIRQVLSNGQTEEHDLEGWDEELENKQSWITIDPHDVLPTECHDVDASGEGGERVRSTLA